MPHFVCYVTEKLFTSVPWQQVLQECNFELSKCDPSFNLNDFKGRVMKMDACYLYPRDGIERSDNIHIELHMLSGRSAELKKACATRIADLVYHKICESFKAGFELTFTIIDLDRSNYVKLKD